jgi:hypothetical protein
MFLIRDSLASLTDGSRYWIRTIRMRVLGLQASHLLLIRTNLGCGTVLTAACARRGCSANDLVWFGLLFSFWSIPLCVVRDDIFNNVYTSTCRIN